jgi:uncharacterized protein (DUF2147 family)
MTGRDKPGLRFLALVFLFVTIRAATAAPNLTGLWLTTDRDGIIKISNCGGDLCAEIAGLILDHPNDATPVDYRGVSQCHLPLITDARPIQPNLWKGHIADPRNGGVYGVELHVDPRGNLALRGFLGISLLGRTQTWTRYAGQVPGDCRMHTDSTGAGPAGALPPGQEGAP